MLCVSSVFSWNPPHHFLDAVGAKLSMQPGKFAAPEEMLLETETQQND